MVVFDWYVRMVLSWFHVGWITLWQLIHLLSLHFHH